MGRTHSVLSYDCRPQVLEFLLKTKVVSEAEESNFDEPDDAAKAHVFNSGFNSVKPISIAVTVYGKSRDLLSESDPLFFEVGLNAPINVSHSFFLALGAFVRPVVHCSLRLESFLRMLSPAWKPTFRASSGIVNSERGINVTAPGYLISRSHGA